jgi:hypothetical protein
MIRRCTFTNISVAGFSTEAPNSLNWYAWDSYFVNVTRGMTNNSPLTATGFGNFNAYRCVFRNNTVADIDINNLYFFGFFDNWSLGSAQFLRAAPQGGGAQVLLSGNTIVSTTNSISIEWGNAGNLALLDNKIVTKPGGVAPAVHAASGRVTVISVGNKYTVNKAISAPGGAIINSINDLVVSSSTINQAPPTLPPPALNLNRTIFDVAAGANAATILTAVNNAATAGNRSAVHLSTGSYSIASTITIAGNTPIQIIGDGWSTALKWIGPAGGKMFDCLSPCQAKFDNFSATGNTDLIVIEGADQAGGRVYGSMYNSDDNSTNNILSNGLVNTNVNIEYLGHTLHAGGTSILAIGAGGSSQVSIFGGASSGNSVPPAVLYDVRSNGSLLVEDIYYEGATQPVINLTSSSSGTLSHTGKIASYNSACSSSVASANGFAGKLLIFESLTDNCGGFLSAGSNAAQNVLVMGTQPRTTDGSQANAFQNSSTAGTWGYLDNHYLNTSGQSLQATDLGTITPAFVLSMLAQLRAAHSTYLTAVPSGATDVRLFHVRTDNGRVGLRIQQGGTRTALHLTTTTSP